jgi:transaldolase
MAELATAGVDIVDVTNLLEEEGVDKFIVSWNELVESVAQALEASK